ncbi:MAG: glutamate-5-semialdehyde dehydrogenase [Nitrospinaceae bacterium]|nr:glutamate-5-semialdehyde dehydrogenase [Nitrospinaceae bacterium]NIR53400.1 glutamate-5-semialdehyde dehydrogenase [Nitrospinaceae bacterium]NIS83804.1 glutamate-5-semialdehyde dehydrogenase [Nitrospinaceae bacterium]NIT80600.1 glutamate-5-semialdehyde dehydrogenase [Nitrospinaceae bacterium]NIU42924.1 glutamate-5-semialdehyde dehydrogenase [Nitrospinaceae bacterium]
MEEKNLNDIARDAQSAALILARLSTETKNTVLNKMADHIEAHCAEILAANQKDLEFARKENIAGPLIARLAVDEAKVKGMAQGIRSVAGLADPVGKLEGSMELDDGLVLTRVSCPIGVIGAIFESRPDAVPQISSLCFKSGNAVILKGGTEAQNSNRIIVGLIQKALSEVSGVPPAAVQLIETRSEVAEMLRQDRYINLIVPRGSNAFVRYVQDHTKIPVLGHSEGLCHVYIDEQADKDKAIRIAMDAKLQYPAACNAMETLLIHEEIAPEILPALMDQFKAKKVEIVGCLRACSLILDLKRAENDDWDMEYNDLKLSVKIVDDLTEAIEHINAHGSGHTDTIVTENPERAEQFLNEVDSASVMVNASTRFADGFRFGLGAEIGISTNKTHARGPVGLEGLVIYKYKLRGSGQVVEDYSGDQGKSFKHQPLNTDQ